jgi:hypothetical protein
MFRYVRVLDGDPLPNVSDLKPFKAIVIIDNDPSPQWQMEASRWLIDSGCLYMMAWGVDCSSWDDSVDYASISNCEFDKIPDDEEVMTTWHEKEQLPEVFGYSKEWARHPTVKLNNTLVLHVSVADKHAEFEKLFQRI